MKMKFKSLFCSLLFCFGVSSCSLDEQIYSSAIAETFVKSEQDVLALVNGGYSLLPTFDCFKSNLTYSIMFGSDDVASTSATHRAFNERTVSASNGYFITPWRSFYRVINHANAVIETVQKSEVGSEALRARIIGEMQFMRALSYFYLVRMHGGVPIHTESVTGTSDFYPKRNTLDEVYALLLEDFKHASTTLLPYSQQPAAESGHATKGAAQAMLALAHLTYANHHDLSKRADQAVANYQLAKSYADSVINSNQYSLLSNYASLFDVGQEKNAYQEVIFAIQFTRDATAASASSRGSELAYYTQPSSRYNVCGNVTNGAGAGTARVQPWFYDLYNTGEYAGDYRTAVSFVTRFKNQNLNTDRITYPEKRTATETTEQFPYLNKYIDPSGYQARNNENDFFVIRLSEIFLIKAEAENELNGPTTEAYAAFNKLRERARKADGTVRTVPADLKTGLSKAQFRLKIFDERGLEFVGEGHRWFDSVRMRYLDTEKTMVQYRYEDFYPTLNKTAPVFNATTNTWGGGRVQPANIVPWTPKFLIWPIPSSEIDANPSMTQNPGW
ncbi:RagB/SusD family nutrient uptake outer membrane protein [Dyadobacter sp. CY323]|uniref:RagB/SusD family nutrient uptake outer membrane protein n=1 Tax=Dyadobacter sp. CY323 TaxID=2907302 RepID=UPI001F397DCC|nr:RagB/SusD family nutrient uptake outer membrane protein [Dyadobacter sp. CY323]